jgi:hypothetical protein
VKVLQSVLLYVIGGIESFIAGSYQCNIIIIVLMIRIIVIKIATFNII